jgi:uncharacterized membrane protein
MRPIDQYMKIFFLSIVIMGVFDVLWLWLYMKPRFYQAVRSIQGTEPQIRAIGLLVYVLLGLAMVWFAVSPRILTSVLNGMVLGLVVYGTYDLTNYAVFTNYPVRVVRDDMIWGAVMMGVSAGLVSWLVPWEYG